MKSQKLIAPVKKPKIGLDDSEILKIMTVAALIFRRKFSLDADNHRVTHYEREEQYVLMEPLSDILDHDTYRRIAFKQLDYFPKYGIPIELIYVKEKYDNYENWLRRDFLTRDKSLAKFSCLIWHQMQIKNIDLIKMADTNPLLLNEALELGVINENKQTKHLFSAYMDALKMDEYHYSLIFREELMPPSMLISENLIALNDPTLNFKIQRLINVSLTEAKLSLQAAERIEKKSEMTNNQYISETDGDAVYSISLGDYEISFEIHLKNPDRCIYFTTLEEAKFLLFEHIKMLTKEMVKSKIQKSKR